MLAYRRVVSGSFMFSLASPTHCRRRFESALGNACREHMPPGQAHGKLQPVKGRNQLPTATLFGHDTSRICDCWPTNLGGFFSEYFCGFDGILKITRYHCRIVDVANILEKSISMNWKVWMFISFGANVGKYIRLIECLGMYIWYDYLFGVPWRVPENTVCVCLNMFYIIFNHVIYVIHNILILS